MVQALEQLTDRPVECHQANEGLVPEGCQYPTFYQ
jgi:hypothetical protein